MHIVVLAIQWNPSNADTNGAEESVLYKEVSLYQGLKCMQEWYLGRQKVSLLERCPQFRGVLIGGFHCSAMLVINPRRACARVTVVVLCVCVSVYPSVPTLAASASVETSKQRYSRVSLRLFLD